MGWRLAESLARPEGFEPPTFCFAVGEDSGDALDTNSNAVVLDITDRLPIGPVFESGHLAPVVVLR